MNFNFLANLSEQLNKYSFFSFILNLKENSIFDLPQSSTKTK